MYRCPNPPPIVQARSIPAQVEATKVQAMFLQANSSSSGCHVGIAVDARVPRVRVSVLPTTGLVLELAMWKQMAHAGEGGGRRTSGMDIM